jgi:hypothetical protein
MKNFVNPSGSCKFRKAIYQVLVMSLSILSRLLLGLVSGLANCVKIVHGEPKWETQCSDECAEQFATVEEHCGECEDPQ